MSSPSSASGKRKRSFSQNQHQPASISNPELLQPSSRDASGEDGEDSTDPQTSPNTHSGSKKTQFVSTAGVGAVNSSNNSSSSSSSNGNSNAFPPSKRVRTLPNGSTVDQLGKTGDNIDVGEKRSGSGSGSGSGSATTTTTTTSRGRQQKQQLQQQPGLHIDTPAAASGVVEDNTATTSTATAYNTSNTDDNGQQEIRPPAKGGLQDPVGYRTNPPPVGRPVRVYADGVFDLFHLGHMRQLEQAKKAFPGVYLLVGVTGDDDTHYRKGLTVLSGAERAETVRHCKWVDEVVPNCPWVVSPEFLDEHKIDYVAHDDLPYEAAEGDDIYAPIKAQGKFLVTQRTEGVSTTGVITRIVRDYDQYISRQFKRGASRQELNVSWLKKNELEIRRHVTELRDNIRNNWTTTGQELGRELRQLWQNSRPNSPAPSARNSMDYGNSRSGVTSPTASKSHLSRVEGSYRPDSPAGTGRNEDFATGYSLGLIGGVRAWMMRSRRSLFESNQHHSPSGSDEEQDHEPRNGNGESSAHVSSEFGAGANGNSVPARQES